jgi:SOS-response transcriptional repressor LexA
MGRNSQIAQRLQDGETIQYRPHGNSMTPRVKSGQLVTVEPASLEEVEAGDIVFAKVRGSFYLHLARQIGDDGRVLIANNHGHVNGWTRQVFGKLTKVEP